MKNKCLKERKTDDPYEIWVSADGTWEWRILKKWQVNDDKPYARWFCAVKSPFTHGNFELGDVYVKEIKRFSTKISDDDLKVRLIKKNMFEDLKPLENLKVKDGV